MKELNATVVEQTTALALGPAGAAKSALYGLTILLNGTAVTVDVAGFVDEDGDAKTLRFTGSTTADVNHHFGGNGLVPTGGTLTVTASIADKALIHWRVRDSA
jgi:hypothetical protein